MSEAPTLHPNFVAKRKKKKEKKKTTRFTIQPEVKLLLSRDAMLTVVIPTVMRRR